MLSSLARLVRAASHPLRPLPALARFASGSGASSGPVHRRNMEIQGVSSVLLINENGEQVGVLPFREAMRRAAAANLDLVEVAPQAQPPVCKLLDYGKFMYEQKKKEKLQAEHNRHASKMKEMKIGSKIEAHDFQTKLANVRRFLRDGHPVRLCIVHANKNALPAERLAIADQMLLAVQKELAGEGELMGEKMLRGTEVQITMMPKRGGTTAAAAGATTAASASASTAGGPSATSPSAASKS